MEWYLWPCLVPQVPDRHNLAVLCAVARFFDQVDGV
jgi:hypothetical protein